MENQTIVNGAIGIILLLIAGYMAVGDVSLEPTHYCEERQIKAYCYSLSSTMKTCYTEMDNSGGKRCNIWKEIGAIENLPGDTPLTNPVEGTKWACSPGSCVKIK